MRHARSGEMRSNARILNCNHPVFSTFSKYETRLFLCAVWNRGIVVIPAVAAQALSSRAALLSSFRNTLGGRACGIHHGTYRPGKRNACNPSTGRFAAAIDCPRGKSAGRRLEGQRIAPCGHAYDTREVYPIKRLANGFRNDDTADRLAVLAAAGNDHVTSASKASQHEGAVSRHYPRAWLISVSSTAIW